MNDVRDFELSVLKCIVDKNYPGLVISAEKDKLCQIYVNLIIGGLSPEQKANILENNYNRDHNCIYLNQLYDRIQQ